MEREEVLTSTHHQEFILFYYCRQTYYASGRTTNLPSAIVHESQLIGLLRSHHNTHQQIAHNTKQTCLGFMHTGRMIRKPCCPSITGKLPFLILTTGLRHYNIFPKDPQNNGDLRMGIGLFETKKIPKNKSRSPDLPLPPQIK